jgi:uncharacterized repeat protein (TIGR03803 family)
MRRRLPNSLAHARLRLLALAVLAGAFLPAPAPSDTPTTILHTFWATDGSDGYYPEGSVILVGDSLYGMTRAGGSGQGTVYRLNKNGSDFSVLHTFTAGTGVQPHGALTYAEGKLYGLTSQTSPNDYDSGVLFEMNLDGSSYSVLYDFGASPANGHTPWASVAYAGGALYGMTQMGGDDPYWGKLFKYDLRKGNYTILHSFGWPPDGCHPYGGLVVAGDVIYGMTTVCGTGTYSDGTIFRINTNGTDYAVLHSFSRGSADNGSQPYGDLVLVGDVLYGTTRMGGLNLSDGLGTVFKINTDGTGFEVLHAFLGQNYNPQGDDDGSYPMGTLRRLGSYLYGLTSEGGAFGVLRGTIFRVALNGSDYATLHHFSGYPGDAANPYHTWPVFDGTTMYGTTMHGGLTNGLGAVFSMVIEDPVAVPQPPGSAEGRLFAVGAPVPNPGVARATTLFPIRLSAADAVKLELFDLSGRLVATRPFEELSGPGLHQVRWSPARIPAGDYFVRARTRSGLEGSTRWTVLR